MNEPNSKATEYADKNWLRFIRQYAQTTDPRNYEDLVRNALAYAFMAGQNLERARSAKLIEMLIFISRRVQTSHLHFGWADLHEIGSWADKALAEYEAGK